MRGMCVEVGTQPSFFSRTLLASAHFSAFAVENDDMPRAQFVAVITLAGIPRARAKVVEIGCRAVGMELMISYRRTGSVFVTSPSGLIAVFELLSGAALVCVVSGG